MRSTLFTIFGIPIRSYGAMMVLGFSLGIWRAVRVCRKRYGIEPERVYDLSLILLLAGVIGARIAFVLLNPQTERWSDIFSVWQGGLSFHGGFVLAIIAGYVYTRITKISFWNGADLIAPSLAIGYAITRIGCFLNGCCYGAPTNLPWAVRFNENGILTPPSHPTQIYAFLINIAIFLVLARLEKMRRAPGFVFMSYVGLYGVYRFFIEILRSGYSAQAWHFGITQAQAVSLLMVLISVISVVWIWKKGTPNKPQ